MFNRYAVSDVHSVDVSGTIIPSDCDFVWWQIPLVNPRLRPAIIITLADQATPWVLVNSGATASAGKH